MEAWRTRQNIGSTETSTVRRSTKNTTKVEKKITSYIFYSKNVLDWSLLHGVCVLSLYPCGFSWVLNAYFKLTSGV